MACAKLQALAVIATPTVCGGYGTAGGGVTEHPPFLDKEVTENDHTLQLTSIIIQSACSVEKARFNYLCLKIDTK